MDQCRELYLIGSLRNPQVPSVASALREAGIPVFDSWFAAGPKADDCWRDYERERGHSYPDALAGYAAQHVFRFDLKHLNRCDGAVLVMPGGKSAHLELGYVIGKGKPGWILFTEEPARYDVMHNFATGVCFSLQDLIADIKATFERMSP